MIVYNNNNWYEQERETEEKVEIFIGASIFPQDRRYMCNDSVGLHKEQILYLLKKVVTASKYFSGPQFQVSYITSLSFLFISLKSL